jgi:hypothetical protein
MAKTIAADTSKPTTPTHMHVTNGHFDDYVIITPPSPYKLGNSTCTFVIYV